MSVASDLIERMEADRECNDVATEVLIKHQMSPEYKREQESKKLMAIMLVAGMPPNDLKKLLG